MTWEAKRNKLDELLKKALIEEPCLGLPVIEQKIGIDAQYDMLDSLIYDALLEEDFSPLPVVDPKIVQWIDWLEKLEEKQSKSTSDAYEQQKPEREEETIVQAVKVNKVKQKEFQPQKCDMCNKEFRFPVNMRRHKWRHYHKTEKKILESSRDQFREYWEKLEDEKACKILCIKDAVLPANLTELQCNDMVDAVSSYVEALDDESRRLEYNLLLAFLLKPDGANKCLPLQEILDALRFLSDDTFFRGTSNLEMEQIVFPHAISMAEIEEQGLLASVGFLVECCMMKAWADDRKRMADLLVREEEAAKKQMELTASTSKAKKK